MYVCQYILIYINSLLILMVCVYIYIHTHIDLHVCIYVHAKWPRHSEQPTPTHKYWFVYYICTHIYIFSIVLILATLDNATQSKDWSRKHPVLNVSYIYIYIYIYIIYIHASIYVYIHICMYMYIYMYVYMYTHMYTYVHVHVCVYEYIFT